MIEKVMESAERTASRLSRRGFLSRLSRMAMATTGAIAGVLSLPGEVSARGKSCSTSLDCPKNHFCCDLNGRCMKLNCPPRVGICGCLCCTR